MTFDRRVTLKRQFHMMSKLLLLFKYINICACMINTDYDVVL